jgi:hypothetical protein
MRSGLSFGLARGAFGILMNGPGSDLENNHCRSILCFMLHSFERLVRVLQ